MNAVFKWLVLALDRLPIVVILKEIESDHFLNREA